VLTRAHRLTSTLDYSRVVRRGARFSSGSLVLHVLESGRDEPRYGFVVSKTVGNAPTRNLVKRRLKALARPTTNAIVGDAVIRALPSAAGATWSDLSRDFEACLDKYGKTRA
jgi:ribonuclease P protein component